jgi:hypothetical protein
LHCLLSLLLKNATGRTTLKPLFSMLLVQENGAKKI